MLFRSDVKSAESCKINIDGYRYVNPSSETITLGMNDEDNVITLYYTKRTDLSYTLKFYDVDTYEQIHTDKTVGSQTFESVISAANAKIDIDGLCDSSYLKRNLEIKGQLFPTVMLTERPDKSVMALLEGKIVIVVDNSPYALIVPSFLIDFFHTVDD